MPHVNCFNWLDIAFTMLMSDHTVDMVQLKQTWTLMFKPNQAIQKCPNCDQNHMDYYKCTLIHMPYQYLDYPRSRL